MCDHTPTPFLVPSVGRGVKRNAANAAKAIWEELKNMRAEDKYDKYSGPSGDLEIAISSPSEVELAVLEGQDASESAKISAPEFDEEAADDDVDEGVNAIEPSCSFYLWSGWL